jgi:hypothetical protein
MNLQHPITIEAQDESATLRPEAQGGAVLIVNADDWGRDRDTTDRILECVLNGSVSSVSAMVFMEDAERGAALAREQSIDAGLHLNFTTPFSTRDCVSPLYAHQQRIARWLGSSRFAPVVYHPGLVRSFRYVVEAQLDEFERLYGCRPRRIDGHHHMHLAANVLGQKLLPAGAIVRRNLSFRPGEKSVVNRLYRGGQDRRLGRRHRLTDFFFDILPLDRARLLQIVAFSHSRSVEIETHPSEPKQYEFLMRGGLAAVCPDVKIARGFGLRSPGFLEPVPVNGAGGGQGTKPHITVCICTYKRPVLLCRLLDCLGLQDTGGLFTYSIVVADNDETRSAEPTVRQTQIVSPVRIAYCVEPVRGIARARNQAVANAEGDFIAMIDDDEFPAPGWLLKLFKTCTSYNVDGVLGPVRRHFDEEPPAWLRKSKLYDRRVNPTGMLVHWREARTGNVLMRRSLLAADPAPFRPEFKAGEDQDFFERKIGEGRRFIWSGEAEVFETLPPARWTRRYYLRRAYFQGAHAALQPGRGMVDSLKSVVAIPVYTAALPLALLCGQHYFMTLMVKLCDHAGRLLFKMKINPMREEYLNDQV